MFKEIKTPCGIVKGKIENGIAKFKGIRYATAERWKYPSVVKKWDGVLEAFDYGACCYQKRGIISETITKPFYYKEYREGLEFTYSEDCLFLNIFTPEDVTEDSNLPVIFYIHGGTFRSGSANEKGFMDPIWPTKGVIGVTINYRLNILGFGCFKEAEDEDGHTGNYGLADQIAALEWLKDNISSFGGNPNNITIMGQSAGAMSVQALCLSPKTKGLFQKAVMLSGGGISRFMPLKPSSSRMKLFEKLFEITGCSSLEELRKFNIEELYHKYYELCDKDSKMAIAGIPCVDGQIMIDSQFKVLNKLRNIPCLIGTTSEDIVPNILYSMAEKWCLLQDKKGFDPSYLWMFNRALPGDDSKAFHCADIWYWFGTLDNCWRQFEERDYKLMEEMVTYLCNFAKNGNPNDEKTFKWLPINKKQKMPIIFGEDELKMKKVNKIKLFLRLFTRPVGF